MLRLFATEDIYALVRPVEREFSMKKSGVGLTEILGVSSPRPFAQGRERLPRKRSSSGGMDSIVARAATG